MLYLKELNTADVKAEYLALQQIPKDENGFINEYCGMDASEFFHKGIITLKNNAKGIDLRVNYVPSTYYFLWQDKKIVGLFKLRHYLNEALRCGAGHVGFTILSAYRNRGYAKKGLQMLVEMARDIILEDELYFSANRSNPASTKVQLACGAYIHHVDEEKVYCRISLRK